MAVRITRKEVLDNIQHLQEKVIRIGQRRFERVRKYPALVNKKTGSLLFEEKTPSEEWIQIQLEVENVDNQIPHFSLDSESPSELTALASRILSETLNTLNQLAIQNPTQGFPEIPEMELLTNLPNLDLELPGAADMPGWKGEIDRMAAEKFLNYCPKGTYLLRQGDEFAYAVAESLSETHKMRVKPCLITIKEEDKRVSEALFLFTDLGWTIYRDNPELNDPEYQYFSTLQETLWVLAPQAKKPL